MDIFWESFFLWRYVTVVSRISYYYFAIIGLKYLASRGRRSILGSKKYPVINLTHPEL